MDSLITAAARKAHEREHVGFRLVHERCELRELRSQLLGHRTPLRNRVRERHPARFLETADPKSLDVACVADIRQPLVVKSDGGR